MVATHIIAGAQGTSRIVLDDADRANLVEALREALRADLLAYCVMDTHVHAVAAGASEPGREALAAALRAYRRAFRRRRGFDAPPLRGPVEALPVLSDFELARTIRYVHENPTKTRPPVVERAVEYLWSSQRDFSGVRYAPAANVGCAVALLGRHAARTVGWRPPLSDLGRVPAPTALPDLLLAAAAQSVGVDPSDVAGTGRAPLLALARRVYAGLGELEAYTQPQLAPLLGRTPARISQLAADRPPPRALRIARTLLRDPRLRRALAASRAIVTSPAQI